MLFERMMGEIMLTPEDEPPEVFSNLTHSQRRAFLFVALRGPRRMSDIARLLSIGLPATTPVIDGLVRKKLVKRSADANDRRVVLVGLTPTGLRHHRQMGEHHARKLERAFSHLDAAQQRKLLEHLRQVVGLLHGRPPDCAPPRSGRRG